jgi:Kef-type K+ transport system membrane component KefB
MAAGGTVITDTLALFVLAVVVGSVDSDDRPAVIFLLLTLGLVVLTAYCAFVLPWLGRWAFAHLGEGRAPRFLFLLAALTSAALVADRMGLEGIVGAFFAGLALNRLVPSGGELMETVELIGGVLLVPFFLLSTGMLLDPEQFTEPDVLVIAGASLAIVLVGKAAASYLSGRRAGFDLAEVKLVFGLTVAQAAATLAAVTIGTEVGIFDEDLLSATLVVVLVTVIVAGIVTKRAARRLDPASVAGEPATAVEGAYR